MKIAGMNLPSPTECGRADFETIMARTDGTYWKQKEALLMILSHMAKLKIGEHCNDMAQSLADYFVAVQSGRIK